MIAAGDGLANSPAADGPVHPRADTSADASAGAAAGPMGMDIEVKPLSNPPTLLHLVCAGRAADGLTADGLDGFEPAQQVECITAGALTALVVRTAPDYFTGPDAEARLADLAWVAPRAVHHEMLVRTAMARGPVFPVPFGTLFKSAGTLAAAMHWFSPQVEAFLKRVAGKEEFGIRIAFDRHDVVTAVHAQLAAARPMPTSPGARYLLDKRLRDEAARLAETAVDQRCAAILSRLHELAAEIAVRRSASDRGDGLETAASYAALVSQDQTGALREAVDTLALHHSAAGLRVELTGPWPPYSFCPALGQGAR